MWVALTAVAAFLGFVAGAGCMRPRLRRTSAELLAARRLAERDPLTGLPNRTGLERRFHELAAAGTPPAAVLLDLDDFKQVNDTWGHQAGDAHLTAVGARLAQVSEQVGAVAGRLAGDEFLILLPCATASDAVWAGKAALAALEMPTLLPGSERGMVPVVPTASAGISLPEADGTWGDLLRRADIALYHAKLRRGDTVLHTTGMRQPDRCAIPAR